MSEVRVNKISPRSGTTVTLGDSGDTISIPSGVTFDASSGGLAGTLTTAAQPNITSVGTLTSFTSTGIDDNATSTAVTIDSSENVLVGKTSANTSTVGAELRPDGLGSFTRSGTYPIIANRTTSDGDVISIRKDGTVVGSIASVSGTVSFGQSDTALVYDSGNDQIRPYYIGSGTRDNAIDLGSSSGRFKDLYLGGGAYLGGTGTANKLDDYEEGTWTPFFSGGFTGTTTFSIQKGTYTKIGRNVFFTIHIATTSATVDATRIDISTLPFTPSNATDISAGGASWSYANSSVINSTSNNLPVLHIQRNISNVKLYETDGTNFNGTDLNNPSGLDFYINGQYITD